jgi:hypothetical protein
MENVYTYFCARLAGLRELRILNELIANPLLKKRQRNVVDNKYNSICYEMAELLDYWNTQFRKKSPLDAEELLVNKLENYYDGFSTPSGYNPLEFTTQKVYL